MATLLENLNLEEGKSDALRAALSCIAEASALDGGPRYSEKVTRELARIIVCRSYAKPLLELSHLMVAASRCGGSYENLFWGISRATSSEFRRSFAALHGASDDISISEHGVSHNGEVDVFQISFARMPLLAALLEFMLTTIGFPEIDEMTSAVRDRAVTHEAVLETARAMQRSLYAYLKDHLPPVQRQRRERHFLDYVDQHAGNRTDANAITDDVVLGYWLAFAEGSDIEAKTYRGVYETARRLIIALDVAEDRLSSRHARTIGTDFEAGEIDPANLDAVVSALDDGESPLQRLIETCGEQVKFINVSEAEVLSDLPLNDGTARRMPKSVLRNAVFGAVQLRLTMALRRGDALAQPLPSAADEFYQARLALYNAVISGTEKLALAAMWALHQAQRNEAIELALKLAPDINWGGLARHDNDAGSENVVSIAAVGALNKFFELEPNARGDELSALLADAKRAWRQVNRAGFRDDALEISVDVMAEAVPDVLRLIDATRQLLDRDFKPVDWPGVEIQDASTFAGILRRLYALNEDTAQHAD